MSISSFSSTVGWKDHSLSPYNGVGTLWKSVSKRCPSSHPVRLLNRVIWSSVNWLAWPCCVVSFKTRKMWQVFQLNRFFFFMIVFAILNHFPVFCETESACQFLLGSKSVGISEGARRGWLAFVAMAALGMSWHPSTKQMLLSGANHDKDGHDLTRTEPLQSATLPWRRGFGFLTAV